MDVRDCFLVLSGPLSRCGSLNDHRYVRPVCPPAQTWAFLSPFLFVLFGCVFSLLSLTLCSVLCEMGTIFFLPLYTKALGGLNQVLGKMSLFCWGGYVACVLFRVSQ